MAKTAMVLAPGFEEIEALATVDILRRASITCDIVGFDDEVKGAHDITVKADKKLDDSLASYDLIILPGGMPGAKNLKENATVIRSLQTLNETGKPVAAICAAPMVLEEAGLLKDKNFTCFPGIEEDLTLGSHQDAVVVKDGNVITSRGPATAFEFGFALVDLLNEDADKLREEMQYSFLLENK